VTRTLLVSPDGMLGRAFAQLLAEAPAEGELLSVRFPELDLTRPETFAILDRFRPTRVILCAAYTDVDGAERNEALATAINGDGVGALAVRCRELGATLVHFGSDYVFDGRGHAPYPVDAPLAPQGAYARSKARGEVLLRESGAEHLYVRTSWLYAPWGKNFVRTIARNARIRPELKVVDDQRGRPTSAEHLARTTLALLERGARGTFHVTDGGECTWFRLASTVVRELGLAERCRVLPCTSDEWPSPVRRPAYSVLDLAETEALVGAMPPWEANVRDALGRLEPDPT
jgi:dTDP-4-dehydrorhamnose reductase